jgi:hypothetical protein
MGYVRSNLVPGEEILAITKPHWTAYSSGAFMTLVGVILFPTILQAFSFPLLVGGMATIIVTWISITTSEIAVTNRRAIGIIGLIRRQSIELRISQIEGLTVEQTLTGRLFNFGTIIFQGTGGGTIAFRNIANPLDFRRKALEALDMFDRSSK